MIQGLDHCTIPIVHRLVSNIYKSCYIPKEMNELLIVALPRKLKATMCPEYRTLSLMSHLLKMILRIILMRNRLKIENEISELQREFMAGKGTREGIFNLRMVCDRYSEVNQDVYACFIDCEKAFDRANHETMSKCLNDIGINGKDLKLIVNLYWTQRAPIPLEKIHSEEIRIKTGVRQGCVLSPYPFNLYTETIFKYKM